MIRSNVKEGSNAQRTIVQTYNFDLKQNKELSLMDVIKRNNFTAQTVPYTYFTHMETTIKPVKWTL